ncbi:MAG: Uma2 family endonuclease [Pseudomonadota bacterium]
MRPISGGAFFGYYAGMPDVAPKPWSVADFLAWERTQEDRYEWLDGFVRMMVGGTADHNAISGNLFAALHAALRGGRCRVFFEIIKVVAADAIMYPDLVVTCAEVAPKADAVPEPVIVVEVLSRSTADFDRSRKWVYYQSIPSLAHYVLVSQDEPRVEIYTRRPAGWDYAVLTDPGQSLRLTAIDVEIGLAAIYEGTSVAGPPGFPSAGAP